MREADRKHKRYKPDASEVGRVAEQVAQALDDGVADAHSLQVAPHVPARVRARVRRSNHGVAHNTAAV